MKFENLKFKKINNISYRAEIELENGFLIITKTTLGDRFNFSCFEANKNMEISRVATIFDTEKEVQKWIDNYVFKIRYENGKKNIVVAFSGGRTSGFMCWWLKKYMSHLYNFIFVYANTGLEHEKSLEFVDKCDKYFKLDLVWVEAKINKGNDSSYTITNYKDACRDNRLFKDMCRVYGLMNGTFIHCTRELKNRPIRKFAVEFIGYDYKIALGIRHDEIKKRLKPRTDAIYPLATIGKFNKEDILNWWKEQPFDLEIEEHYGNCVGCYKKSDKKLKMIADENPNYFDAFIELENEFGKVKSIDEDTERVIFRNFRTAYEVKNNLKLPLNLQDFDECAEECGSMMCDYESIPIITSEDFEEKELNLFDFIN